MAHQAGAVVLDVLLVQDVAADLAAPLDGLHLAAQLREFLLLLLPLELEQPGLQDLQGDLLVLVLAARVLAGHDDPGGQVHDPHRAVRGVHALTAVPLAAEHVDAQVLGLDLDLHGVVHLGHDLHPGERGVPPPRGVKGRGADQAVHPALHREEAVRVLPAHDDLRVIDPGLRAGRDVHHLHAKAQPVREPPVHPQEHLRPVAGLRAPRARLDRENSVLLRVGKGQERLVVERLELFLGFLELAHKGLALLRVELVPQLRQPLEVGLEGAVGLDRAAEPRGLLADAPGALSVVPEVRVVQLGLEIGQAAFLAGDVKDTPLGRRVALRAPSRP